MLEDWCSVRIFFIFLFSLGAAMLQNKHRCEVLPDAAASIADLIKIIRGVTFRQRMLSQSTVQKHPH